MCPKLRGKSVAELGAETAYFVFAEPQQQMLGASEALSRDP